jgi:non-ribosomal peptide synthetase component E (peptide arylation enzyme)
MGNSMTEQHHVIASHVIAKAMEKLAAAGIDRSVLASAAVAAGVQIALDDQHMTAQQCSDWLGDIAEAITKPASAPTFSAPHGNA